MGTSKKRLFSGNEAIARGAYEAGVRVAAGYPGTPATEILESLAKYEGVYAEWSVNEKVALEVASGASIAGARALAAMKHVGLNVASDPLMTLSYTGVGGGLVIVTADDPGHHSSQNEQDNRNYAAFAKLPMLEPADSGEAYRFARLAFALSEKFDTPVLVRTTTRISHSRSVVTEGRPGRPRAARMPAPDPAKYVMIPGYSEARHEFVEDRLAKLGEFAESFEHNRAELRSKSIGVITSGISYQYVREAAPSASVLKLGMCYPLPAGMMRDFAARVKKLYVVEELDPFIERQVLAQGIKAAGKLSRPGFLPLTGELDTDTVRAALSGSMVQAVPGRASGIPSRTPALCPGCPHRGVFYALKKCGYFVAGDIGCYTLAHAEPLSSVHTTLCMGAGISQAHGMMKAIDASGDDTSWMKLAAVIGDSTFLHSGMAALLNTVYNRGSGVVVVLDNKTTAMTGRQAHPGTGATLAGDKTKHTDVVDVVRGLGVRDVTVIDPYDVGALIELLSSHGSGKGPRVIVARRPCVLMERKRPPKPFAVDAALCVNCGDCLDTACPAISRKGEVVTIDPAQCTACGICAAACGAGAIGAL